MRFEIWDVIKLFGESKEVGERVQKSSTASQLKAVQSSEKLERHLGYHRGKERVNHMSQKNAGVLRGK